MSAVLSATDIIAEHHGYFDVHRMMFVCRCGVTWPALSDDYDAEIRLHAEHQQERLGAAGHTIVQLPEPDEAGRWRVAGTDLLVKPFADRSGPAVAIEMDSIRQGARLEKRYEVSVAPDLAVALLAAAASATTKEKP